MKKKDFNQFIVSSFTICILLGILVFSPSKTECYQSVWILSLSSITILGTMCFAFYSICKLRGEESEEIKRKKTELAIKIEWEEKQLELEGKRRLLSDNSQIQNELSQINSRLSKLEKQNDSKEEKDKIQTILWTLILKEAKSDEEIERIQELYGKINKLTSCLNSQSH